MANLSDAFGVFKVKADTKLIANAIMSIIFDVQKRLEYNMSETNVDDRTFCEDCNGKCEVETGFYGTGRWDFNNNICEMSKWEEWNELKNSDLKVLIENYWELTYDYKDIELGGDFFCEAVTSVRHEKGKKLKDIVFINGDCSSIDINVYNLMKYEVSDCVDEALDYLNCNADAINWFDNPVYRKTMVGYCKRGLKACMDENNITKEEAIKKYFNSDVFVKIVNYVEE